MPEDVPPHRPRSAPPDDLVYRDLVEALEVGLWVIDAEAVTTFVNGPMARMLGYAPEEMVGRHLFAFMDERGRAISTRNLERRQAGIREQHDFELMHRDGSRVYTAMETSPLLDAEGDYRGAVAGVIDITARRSAEDQLARSEERFRTLFERVGVGIGLAAPDGEVLRVNPALAELLGYAPEEMRGKHLSDFFAPGDRRDAAEALASLRAGTASQLRHERRYLHREGHEIEALVSVAGVRDEGGALSAFIGAVQDIGDRKRAERDLVRAQKLESLGVLAGGIAHDYNNLLTAVLANLSLAMVDASGPQRERLRDAENAARQAASLARQLLTFARGGDPIREPLDLAQLVRDTARFSFAGSRLRAALEIPDDLGAVEADAGQLAQVLSNLFTNAIQAQREGTVSLRARRREITRVEHHALPPGRYLELEVEDAGEGIPPDRLDRVFDPYFTTRPGGSGLGLAVTHRVVERHGGHISVRSTLGEGTVFTVLLPEADASPTAPSASEAPPRFGARALVMDDDPLVRSVLSNALAHLGCDVEEASDGEAAVRAYERAEDAGAPFDVVFVDLTVPGGMGGVEAVAKIRERAPEVCAVATSGYSNDPVMSDHARHGLSAVLPKPWALEQLAKVLEGVLETG